VDFKIGCAFRPRCGDVLFRHVLAAELNLSCDVQKSLEFG
jgi:hypothetical protein